MYVIATELSKTHNNPPKKLLIRLSSNFQPWSPAQNLCQVLYQDLWDVLQFFNKALQPMPLAFISQGFWISLFVKMYSHARECQRYQNLLFSHLLAEFPLPSAP